ncbi:MAG: hypothetical protein JRE24_10130 [Deltaproteobacteria bacterium]|nr:hypothetical protein [Deltaproteobacteria bacterium]
MIAKLDEKRFLCPLWLLESCQTVGVSDWTAPPLLIAFVARWSARDEPEALPDRVTVAERMMGCPSKKKLG